LRKSFLKLARPFNVITASIILMLGLYLTYANYNNCQSSAVIAKSELNNYIGGSTENEFIEQYKRMGHKMEDIRRDYSVSKLSTLCGESVVTVYEAYNYSLESKNLIGAAKFSFYNDMLYHIEFETRNPCVSKDNFKEQDCRYDAGFYYCTGNLHDSIVNNIVIYDERHCYLRETWSNRQIEHLFDEDVYQANVLRD